jgi:hypothetical protein
MYRDQAENAEGGNFQGYERYPVTDRQTRLRDGRETRRQKTNMPHGAEPTFQTHKFLVSSIVSATMLAVSSLCGALKIDEVWNVVPTTGN